MRQCFQSTLSRHLALVARCFSTISTLGKAGHAGAGLNVFDRDAKRMQREWAAKRKDNHVYDYLKEEVAYRLADRVFDIKKYFDVVVDLGSGRGLLAPHIFKDNVGSFIQIELSPSMLLSSKKSAEVPTEMINADEEMVPLTKQSVDLALSSLSMHWINDLPGFFQRTFDLLRPDGAFIASVFGGDTLYEMRCSLQLADMERRGGMESHVSPFAQIADIGGLLNRAEFRLLTVDIDEMVVNYPDMLSLMFDLQGMAENAATWRRPRHLHRDVIRAANAIYKEMYGSEDGYFPATFQIIYLIGWRPGPNMAKPAQRGSQTVSLKDVDKFVNKGS